MLSNIGIPRSIITTIALVGMYFALKKYLERNYSLQNQLIYLKHTQQLAEAELIKPK